MDGGQADTAQQKKGRANVPDVTSDAPVPEVQAPSADTPDATQTDTAQTTPSATDEFAGRYVALQAEFSRRFPTEPIPPPTGDTAADYAALRRDFSLRTAQPKPGPKAKDDGIDYKAEWEKSEQERAEAVFGKDAMAAFRKAKLAYERDPSPFGELTMMEAYRQLMATEVKPAVKEEAPPKGQAVAPRVDSNRSDVSPDLALPTKADEARRGDKLLEQGIAGLLSKVPWGNR